MWIPLRISHALTFLRVKPLQKKNGEFEIMTDRRAGLELVCTPVHHPLVLPLKFITLLFSLLLSALKDCCLKPSEEQAYSKCSGLEIWTPSLPLTQTRYLQASSARYL